jgi:hypothetical protein
MPPADDELELELVAGVLVAGVLVAGVLVAGVLVAGELVAGALVAGGVAVEELDAPLLLEELELPQPATMNVIAIPATSSAALGRRMMALLVM